MLAQRSGSLAAGSYWSYHGLLGPTEIFAINQKSTVMYGVLIGYKTNGRLVEIKIDMRALESDTERRRGVQEDAPHHHRRRREGPHTQIQIAVCGSEDR